MKTIKYIFFVMLILMLSYFICGELLLPRDVLDQRNICELYEGQWYQILSDGSRKLLEVPQKYDPPVRQLETTIPDNLDPGISCLCFRGQDLRAYLDDELIYTYSTEKSRWFGKTSPENYLTIPITAQDAGKTLRLELTSVTGLIYQPYVGSEIGIWSYILHMYAGELVVAVITLIMGTLTILISRLYGWFRHRTMEITYLGCGVTFAAIWLIVNSVFRQILFPNVSVASDIPFLIVMLMPFPFIIYMNEIQSRRYSTMYKLVAYILTAINVSCCMLYITGKREIEQTFIFVTLGCFLAIGAIFVTFVMDFCNRKIKEYHYVALGLVCAFVTSIIQLVIYFNRTGIFRGSFFAIGLLLLLLGSVIHTIKFVFSIEREKTAAVMANAAKSKFLANMSHEIRTPINAILGMDEMILRESQELQIREYALDIRNAGKSLLSLINDILDISKIDSGKLEIIPVEYDVSSLIHDTINMISQKATSKELTVTLNLDEQIPSRLMGDDIRIRQILVNILNNAVKYTNTGGITLSVSGQRQSDYIQLHFEVQDTGIGIKEEDLPKLFEEFRRIEENRNHSVEGTGLGMSITVQLLTLMGSHLNVTSSYGEGSCFFFDLRQKIVDERPVGNLSERIRDLETEYDYNTTFCAPDADILIVDDNAVNRKVLRNLLKDTLIRMDEADSGEECLSKITIKKYDLIFMDHMMPGMDGIETFHAFPSLPGNKNLKTPVVALTANAVNGMREMFLENGFDDFFTKPIVFHKLEKLIMKFLPPEKVKKGQENLKREIKTPEEEKKMQEFLETLPELNLEYAYLHSSKASDLYAIIVDFAKMITSDADLLENFAAHIQEPDILRQYRVRVHSMKTSAAMIGAIHLSGMARMLELAAIEEQMETIQIVTPVFLKEWRGYQDKLQPVLEREALKSDLIVKMEFEKSVFVNLIKRLELVMADFDVDTADAIVSELKTFEYPLEYLPLMEQLYLAVTNLEDATVSSLAEKLIAIEN